jgi:hypothetical protein
MTALAEDPQVCSAEITTRLFVTVLGRSQIVSHLASCRGGVRGARHAPGCLAGSRGHALRRSGQIDGLAQADISLRFLSDFQLIILCSNCVRTRTDLAMSPICDGSAETWRMARHRWDMRAKARSPW